MLSKTKNTLDTTEIQQKLGHYREHQLTSSKVWHAPRLLLDTTTSVILAHCKYYTVEPYTFTATSKIHVNGNPGGLVSWVGQQHVSSSAALYNRTHPDPLPRTRDYTVSNCSSKNTDAAISAGGFDNHRLWLFCHEILIKSTILFLCLIIITWEKVKGEFWKKLLGFPITPLGDDD